MGWSKSMLPRGCAVVANRVPSIRLTSWLSLLLYSLAESAYYSSISLSDADSSISWTVGLKEFAHPAIETFSIVGQAGPTFFLAAAMFGFVIQLGSIVAEKELKLRQVFFKSMPFLFSIENFQCV
jgi:hypothetical protein